MKKDNAQRFACHQDGSSHEPAPSIRFLRCPEVCARTGLSRTTLWKLERHGQFPTRRVLTANTVGWLASEVEEWIITRSSRPSARPWERSARTEPPVVASMRGTTATSVRLRKGRSSSPK